MSANLLTGLFIIFTGAMLIWGAIDYYRGAYRRWWKR